MHIAMLAVFVTTLMSLTTASPGDVVAVVGNSTTPIASAANGAELVVELGDVSSDTLIRVFDAATNGTTAPTIGVGRVTVHGSSSGGRLTILVANASVLAADADPRAFLLPGVVNLGTTSGGIVIPNATLRDATTLALAVSGDITGAIDVGHVFRVQAFGVTNLTTGQLDGGTIASNITAHVGDTFTNPLVNPVLGDLAMNVVQAGKGITGNLIAEYTTSDTMQPATIGRVIVGPAESAVGIQGDLTATGGIGAIFTTGPIGSTSRTVAIHAIGSIGEVRAVQANNIGGVGDKNMFVDISAGHGFLGGIPVGTPDPTRVNESDPTLGRIQTSGTITGTISAYQVEDAAIRALNPNAIGLGTSGTYFPLGVFAGTLSANVNIKGSMTGCIMAHQITGSVRIGWMLDGSIIATDLDNPNAPPIPLVEIGYGTLANTPEDIRRANNPGFIGTDTLNVDGPEGLARSLRDPVQIARLFANTGGNDDVLAGIIAARAITSLRIFRMTGWEFEAPGLGVERFPPIVEVQQLNVLEIGEMRQGVVWSGNFDDAPSTPAPFFNGAHTGLPTDTYPKNDYTAFPGQTGTSPQIKIGCMGNGADLWVKNFNTLRVEHSVLGEIHTLSMASKSTIAIGDALGSESDADFSTCGCREGDENGVCVNLINSSTGVPILFSGEAPAFWSPRYLGNSLGDPAPRTNHGRIWMGETQSLQGQIVLNANNNSVDLPARPSDYWKGEVIVGEPAYGASDPSTVIPSDAVVLSPFSQSLDRRSPFYSEHSAAIGGGAVGVAPYHLHEQDCSPVHKHIDMFATTDGLLENAFTTTAAMPVTMRSYGRIRKTTPSWQTAVEVQVQNNRVGHECEWIDLTFLFRVRGPGDADWTGDLRSIGLSRASNIIPVPGVYRVVPKNIRCLDIVPTTIPLVWPPNCISDDNPDGVPAYVFRILPDCNNDGVNDYFQIAQGTLTDTNGNMIPDQCEMGNPCILDYSDNNTVDVQDIFDFLSIWFAQCTGQANSTCRGHTADFNGIGGITVQDIFDYLTAWFGNGSTGNLHCH